jgi:hypothetical protein
LTLRVTFSAFSPNRCKTMVGARHANGARGAEGLRNSSALLSLGLFHMLVLERTSAVCEEEILDATSREDTIEDCL